MKKIEIKTTWIIIFFNPRQTGTSALFCNHKAKNIVCNNNIGKSLTHWLFIQVHPMSTHLATFEQWLARNFLSFVQLVAIRLTKSLGPKVRNDFPLHWLDEKLCFTQRAKKLEIVHIIVIKNEGFHETQNLFCYFFQNCSAATFKSYFKFF